MQTWPKRKQMMFIALESESVEYPAYLIKHLKYLLCQVVPTCNDEENGHRGVKSIIFETNFYQ